jgi:hypothetical protein
MSNQIKREKILPKKVAESTTYISQIVECHITLQGTAWKNYVIDLLNSVSSQIQQSQESEL